MVLDLDQDNPLMKVNITDILPVQVPIRAASGTRDHHSKDSNFMLIMAMDLKLLQTSCQARKVMTWLKVISINKLS